MQQQNYMTESGDKVLLGIGFIVGLLDQAYSYLIHLNFSTLMEINLNFATVLAIVFSILKALGFGALSVIGKDLGTWTKNSIIKIYKRLKNEREN